MNPTNVAQQLLDSAHDNNISPALLLAACGLVVSHILKTGARSDSAREEATALFVAGVIACSGVKLGAPQSSFGFGTHH